MAAVDGGQFPSLTRDAIRRPAHRDDIGPGPRRIEPMWMLLALAALSWSAVFWIATIIEWLV